MSVGENLKNARIKKGITQKELAVLLKKYNIKVGDTTISNWEKGISKPNPDSIEAICKILNISSDYILGLNNFYISQVSQFNSSINNNINITPNEFISKYNQYNTSIDELITLLIENRHLLTKDDEDYIKFIIDKRKNENKKG